MCQLPIHRVAAIYRIKLFRFNSVNITIVIAIKNVQFNCKALAYI